MFKSSVWLLIVLLSTSFIFASSEQKLTKEENPLVAEYNDLQSELEQDLEKIRSIMERYKRSGSRINLESVLFNLKIDKLEHPEDRFIPFNQRKFIKDCMAEELEGRYPRPLDEVLNRRKLRVLQFLAEQKKSA